jgi:hypothetical protein
MGGEAMISAIGLTLVAALPFCPIRFATMGLPIYMSVVYVAAGIAACLVYQRLATRGDPLRSLKRYYFLGGLIGAAIGLATNGLFALRFKFRLDAAAISALCGGFGAVLYAVMSTATERPPQRGSDPEEDARFFARLRRIVDARRSGRNTIPNAKPFVPHTDENLESYGYLRQRQFHDQL